MASGGYADWTCSKFNGKVNIELIKKDSFHPSVGTWGICVNCACENNNGVYCDDCNPGNCCCCDYCDNGCNETTTAYDRGSNPIEVCGECFDQHFTRCERCDKYVHKDNAMYVEDVGGYYCGDCVDEFCGVCDCCDSIYYRENIYEAHDRDGDEIYICGDCRDIDYHCCENCDELIEDGLCICRAATTVNMKTRRNKLLNQIEDFVRPTQKELFQRYVRFSAKSN